MPDYITLIGAEQVQGAARQMASAAEEMRRAASAIDTAMFQQRQFMDEWLSRLDSLLKEG